MHVPLGSTVAFTASICLYILGNYGHAWSQDTYQWCAVFFHVFFVWRGVVSQPSPSTVGPDIPGIILLYEYDVFNTWHVFIHTECCCRCCCCSVPVLLLQQLLLFDVVCRMAKIVAGSLNLIPSSVFFPLIQTRFIFHVCTSTPWQYCRIYGLYLPILHPR